MSERETVNGTSYNVKLIGVLGSASGKREIMIQGRSRLTLSALLGRLVSQVDKPQFRELLIDSSTQSPLPNVIILLNDQDCNLFQGLRTELDSGTEVTIIPVAHGG